MQKVCANSWCVQSYEVTDEDLAFYEAVSPVCNGTKKVILPPLHCPECRCDLLTLWRNERTIYASQCKKCQKKIISQYAPEKSYNDFCYECFWGDDWNSEDYAQDFDFSQTFFEQFEKLLKKSPLQALIKTNAENSNFCHRIFNGRNNYLSFIALNNPENLIHTYYTITCKDSVDIAQSQYCELCYDVVDAERSYHCLYSNRIRNCRDCIFVQDCIGCHDCFGCKNLNQRSYCIFNEQKTREEYERYISEFQRSSYSTVEETRIKAAEFFMSLPQREKMVINSENVSGSNIFNCRDVQNCYDIYEVEYAKYCLEGEKSHHLHTCMGFGEDEYCYYGVTYGASKSTALSASVLMSSEILYSYDCYAQSANCFGCVGIKKKQYCILNKQYSKEDYENLLAKIIDHMKETGEWGNFFPPSLSPFAYNETYALQHIPLSKEDVKKRGWQWRDIVDDVPEVSKVIPAELLPDNISDIPDDILQWAVVCPVTKRPFRIVQKELEFYRAHNIPIPRLHPDERFRQRMNVRESRQLHDRTCAKCQKPITTSYSPDRPAVRGSEEPSSSRREIVYCERCYLETVY